MSSTAPSSIFPDTPIRPPFDPELAPVAAALREMILPMTTDTLAATREAIESGVPGVEPTDLTVGGAVKVTEVQAAGPEGAPDVTLLILSPAAGATGLPGIYYIHGGGMVTGNRRFAIETYLPYVAEGKAVVVSVEYRLAPENPDPAPVEDCYAGLAWTARHAGEFGIDADRLIIAGPSAGGGLAAGTALLARDRGFPSLSHQVLSAPMLDDRLDNHSSRMLDGEAVWDRNDNLFGWTALLGERRGGSDVSSYAAPARATDLSGLPRTYLDCGSAEGFRDEVLTYARRLSEAGVSVDLHMWGGAFHTFDVLAPHAAIARASNAARDEFIRRAIEK
ncbi:alpha/beta hydrolase [Streptomyces sp. NPDC090499]|uniref:alpha/beta hydrolase n=1 Tax=Streptomyces sp. NPDC090499 TaxID=3365965 RepID=UPI0038208A41